MGAGKDADSALLLILAMLKNDDEDSKHRKVISRTLSKAQVAKYRALIRKNRDDHLFPVDKFYIRTRKNGKKYLVCSRRIHSDNLIKGRKKPLVQAGAII